MTFGWAKRAPRYDTKSKIYQREVDKVDLTKRFFCFVKDIAK